MGESSKKSAPKLWNLVDAAPAVVPPSKFVNKGKREVDDELEKQMSAKKQKRDEVTENQKKEINSDGSFSDTEEDEKLAAKSPVASKKLFAKSGTLSTQAQKGKPAGSPSSPGFSDDDSDVNDFKVAPAGGKNGPSATKKKAESNSEPESSSSDKDDLKTKVSTSPKKLPIAGKKESSKKVASSEASESDSDSRTAEDNVNVAASSKKLLAASGAGNIIPAKKVESSDDSSSDSGSDEDDVQKTHVTPSGSHNVKHEEMVDAASTEATTKEAPKMAATLKEQNATSKTIFVGNLAYRVERVDLENLFEDCGEIVKLRFGTDRDGRFKGFGHVEFATVEAAQKALKLNGNELFRRSVRIEIAREKGAYNPYSRNDSIKYPSLGEDERKLSATPKEQNGTSKTLFVGNLSYSVEKTDLEILFKDCGEIVDIRFATDREGRFKGFGHVEFATEEAAQNALKLDGNELLRRSIRLDLAPERSAYSANSSNKNETFQNVGSGQSQTVFVKGFDTSLEEDEIKTRLEEHFSSCGMISRISVAKDYDTGAAKGFAWLDFKDVDGFNKALELDGTEVGGYTLLVEERRRRRYYQGGRDGGGQFGGWRGSDRWGQERGGSGRWR